MLGSVFIALNFVYLLSVEADVESEGELEPGQRRRHRKHTRKPRDPTEKKKKKKKKEPKPPKASFEGRMRRRFREEYGVSPSKSGKWEQSRFTPPSYMEDRYSPAARFSPGSPFRPTPSIFKPSPIVGRRTEAYGYDAYARREKSYRAYEVEEEEKEVTRGKADALFKDQVERLSRMDFKTVEAEEMEEISISEEIKVGSSYHTPLRTLL